MPKTLQIQLTEKKVNHYLYHLVPVSIQIKVEKLIGEDQLPEIPDDFLPLLLAHGDALLYPDEKNFDSVKEIFDKLTDCLALLAFTPAGFEAFGYHFEVLDVQS